MTRKILSALLVVAVGCSTPDSAPAGGDSGATAAGGMAGAGNDPAAVRAAIEALNAKQVEAVLKGDTANMTANYADDAVFLNPGMPTISGKAGIAALFQGMLKEMQVSEPQFRTIDVLVEGSIAVEHGSYKWTMTPKGGKPMIDSGKYLTVWQKQADGSWKIVRDINNTDLPASPSP